MAADVSDHRPTSLQWARRRTRRHLAALRREGVRRLAEEDRLDPRRRLRPAFSRWRKRWCTWGREPVTQAVFVLGVQRSGTNMVLRLFEQSGDVDVRNESDRRAFRRFRLRPDQTIHRLIDRSPYPNIAFKPLCDSHRTNEMLEEFAPAKALWVYRGFRSRAASAVAKFGDVNARVLREIGDGRGEGMWQAAGLSAQSLAVIQELASSRLTAEDGAALFWLVRNQLFFDLGLDRHPDVMLVSYESLLAEPARHVERICRFVGIDPQASMYDHVRMRLTSIEPQIALSAQLAELCREMQGRLDRACQATPRHGRA